MEMGWKNLDSKNLDRGLQRRGMERGILMTFETIYNGRGLD